MDELEPITDEELIELRKLILMTKFAKFLWIGGIGLLGFISLAYTVFDHVANK